MPGALTVRYTFKSTSRLGGFTAKIEGTLNGVPDGRFRYAVSTSSAYPSTWSKVAEENNDHLLINYTGEIKANTTYYLFVSKETAGNYAYYRGCSTDKVTITGEVVESTLTAKAGTLGTAQTLTINKADTAFTHTIQYTVGSASGTIATKTSAVNVNWTPPLSLASQNTTGKTLSCKLTLTTYSGSTAVGTSETTISLTIPSSTAPTVTAEYEPVNSLPDAFDGLYVQGKSKVKASYTATGEYGASIENFVSTINGKATTHTAETFTSEVITKSGSVSVSVKATDSRGYSTIETGSITVETYTPPAVIPAAGQDIIRCYRADADGVESSTGSYIRISAGRQFSTIGGLNKCTLRYRFGERGGTMGAWTTLLAADAAGNSAAVTVNAGLSERKAYTVEIEAADTIGESKVLSIPIPSADTPLHLATGGLNLGLGCYSSYDKERLIDVGWDMQLAEGVRIRPASGEEMAVLAALGGAAAVRRNLLDNWYFGNPVNQRGETSYTGIVYTIDRWKSRVSTQTVSVEDGCIKTNSPTATGFLTQYLESCPPGKYTASVLVKSVSGTPTASGNYAVLYTSDGTNTMGTAYIKTAGLHFFTFDASVDVSTFQLQTYTGCTIEIVAAKLELGDTQTLAHQDEDGNWQLNEIPNHAEELAKCQRYQYVINGYASAAGVLTSSKGALILSLPTPVSMREKPAVTDLTISGVRTVPGSNTTPAVTSFSVDSFTPHCVNLNVVTATFNTTAYTNNTPVFAYIRTAILDANL